MSPTEEAATALSFPHLSPILIRSASYSEELAMDTCSPQLPPLFERTRSLRPFPEHILPQLPDAMVNTVDQPADSIFPQLPPVLVQHIISHLQQHQPTVTRQWFLPSWPAPPNLYDALESIFEEEHKLPKPFFTTSVSNLRLTCKALRAAAAPLTLHINLHAMYLGHQNYLDLPRLAEMWPNLTHLRMFTEYYEDKICCVEENDPELAQWSSKPKVTFAEQQAMHHRQWDKFGGYCERVAAALRYCWTLVQTAVVPVNADIVFSLVTNCGLLHSVGLSDAMVFDLMDRISSMDVDWRHSLSPGEHLLPCLDLLATCTQLTKLELIQKYAEVTHDELNVLGSMTQLRELSLELDAERMFWLRDGEYTDDSMNMDLALVRSVMEAVGKLESLSHLQLVMLNLHNANIEDLHNPDPHTGLTGAWSLSCLTNLKSARIHVEAKRCRNFWNPNVFQGCTQVEKLVLEPALKTSQAAVLMLGLHNLVHLDWVGAVHSSVQVLDDTLATALADNCPRLAVLKVGAVKLTAAFTGMLLDLREWHVTGSNGFSCEVLVKDFAPRLETLSVGSRIDVHRKVARVIVGHPTLSSLQTVPFALLLEFCGVRRRPKPVHTPVSAATPVSLSTSAESASSAASAATPIHIPDVPQTSSSASSPLTNAAGTTAPTRHIPDAGTHGGTHEGDGYVGDGCVDDFEVPDAATMSPAGPAAQAPECGQLAANPCLDDARLSSAAATSQAGPDTSLPQALALHPITTSLQASCSTPANATDVKPSMAVVLAPPPHLAPPSQLAPPHLPTHVHSSLATTSVGPTPSTSLSLPPLSWPQAATTDPLTVGPLSTLSSLTSLHLMNENYSCIPAEPVSSLSQLPAELTQGWADKVHTLTLSGYQTYKHELGWLTVPHLQALLAPMVQLRVLRIMDHCLIPCTREAVATTIVDVAASCLNKLPHLQVVELHTNMLRAYRGAVEVEEECIPFFVTRFLLALASSESVRCVRLAGVDRKRAGMIAQEVQVARDTHAEVYEEGLPYTVEVAEGCPPES